MNKNFKFSLLGVVSFSCFGPAEDEAAAKKAEEDKKAADEAAKNKPRVYSQKEVDDMTAAQRYGYKKELEKAADREKKMSEDARLSQEERDAAAKREEELRAQYQTEKETSAQREKKLQEAYKKQLDDANNLVTVYKGKYSETLIKAELATECGKVDEPIPGKLLKTLKPDTVLVDEFGADGKPTGAQVVRVNFEDVDAAGKPVKLVLSVPDAIKRMKELPEQYGIYFKGSGTGGVGGNNGKGGGGGGPIADTAAYIAQRNAARKK